MLRQKVRHRNNQTSGDNNCNKHYLIQRIKFFFFEEHDIYLIFRFSFNTRHWDFYEVHVTILPVNSHFSLICCLKLLLDFCTGYHIQVHKNIDHWLLLKRSASLSSSLYHVTLSGPLLRVAFCLLFVAFSLGIFYV